MRGRASKMVRVALTGFTGLGLIAGAGACGDGSSGSSVQPVCDGSGPAGGVTAIVAPTPCDAVVFVPSECPSEVICQITIQNNNAEDIDVRTLTGSGSVATDFFTVLSGQNRVRDVVYSCGAGIDEGGLLQIDVSLAGGPGAFCGRDVDWSVTLTPDP